jgi:hypothetical protein
MAKRKAKRNPGSSKPRSGFKICREPVVHLSAHRLLADAANSISLPGIRATRFLFAVARDAHTIFTSWHVDWHSVFKKGMPADRQVHLRLIGQHGVEQRIGIEPMAAMCYVTIPSPDDSYRVEIGFFQPADTWNSVVISDEVNMPPQGSAEIADVDLATIPFHLSFEQLANLFGAADGTPLARVISKSQKRLLNSRPPNESSADDAQILQKLNLSLPEIAAAQHEFEKSDSAKLTRRARADLRVTTTSPSGAFEANSGG